MADMIFVKDDALMPSDWAYCCSKCKRRISRSPMPDLLFCPYCGSEVKKWDDDGVWWDDFMRGEIT